MEMPSEFSCPENIRHHLAKVFHGEYEIPINTTRPLRILDIGANCGAFALWAANRWPDSEIFCYEPVPETFEYLMQNIKDNKKIYPEQVAVCGTYPSQVPVYLGKNNCGEASIFFCKAQQEVPVLVPSIPAVMLPHADIIKLDVEGAELDILFNLIGLQQRDLLAVLLEYHSEPLRRSIDAILKNYEIIKADIAEVGRGTLCYVNSKIIIRN